MVQKLLHFCQNLVTYITRPAVVSITYQLVPSTSLAFFTLVTCCDISLIDNVQAAGLKSIRVPFSTSIVYMEPVLSRPIITPPKLYKIVTVPVTTRGWASLSSAAKALSSTAEGLSGSPPGLIDGVGGSPEQLNTNRAVTRITMYFMARDRKSLTPRSRRSRNAVHDSRRQFPRD